MNLESIIETTVDINDNILLKWMRKHLRITHEIKDHSFLVLQTKPDSNKKYIYMTPLLVARRIQRRFSAARIRAIFKCWSRAALRRGSPAGARSRSRPRPASPPASAARPGIAGRADLLHTGQAGLLLDPAGLGLSDDELRRMPPADRGELEEQDPQVRGTGNPQLRHLQSAGGAR